MAVVVREQKVLIQQHYRRSRSMVYEFPGGKMMGLMAKICLGVHQGTTLQGGTGLRAGNVIFLEQPERQHKHRPVLRLSQLLRSSTPT